jgi:hypothetical protein
MSTELVKAKLSKTHNFECPPAKIDKKIYHKLYNEKLAKVEVYCEHCDRSYQQNTYLNHTRSKKHKENMKKAKNEIELEVELELKKMTEAYNELRIRHEMALQLVEEIKEIAKSNKH